MNGMTWVYSQDFFNEYDEITTAFFNLFRNLFPKECSIPMLFPNYIALRYDCPEESSGVRCFRLNGNNEFLLNAYPQICCHEITQETINTLPSNVSGAVIELDVFDCARWIMSGFLMFSVGIASMRMGERWKLPKNKTANAVWDFVSNIENDHVKFMAAAIETVIRKEKSIAFGLIDYDKDFVVPYLS